jgi:hypothetical protein
MKYSLEECYSPKIEALIADWDIWCQVDGTYETRAQFWAAAAAVHGITDAEFDDILDTRLDNQLSMYRPWRSDRP